MTFNIGNADQNHAAARERFGTLVERAKQLWIDGLDDPQIVAQLVTELGVPLTTLLDSDQEQFWDELWGLMGALAFGALDRMSTGR
jgi:hypothetical protein